MNNLFEIRNLTIRYGALKTIINNLSFDIKRGDIFSILGETGSGKTLLAKSIIGLNSNLMNISGNIFYNNGKKYFDILSMPKRDIAKLRGKEILWIPQNSEGALNPLLKLEKQAVLPLKNILDITANDAKDRMKILCEELEIGSENLLSLYPHQLSGGMRVRFMIALGIAMKSKVLILDEPTKGLDLKRAQYLMELIKKVISQRDLELILITHDLNLAKTYSKNCLLLKNGELMDSGKTEDVLSKNSSKYAKALWMALPKNGMELKNYD